MNNTNQFINNCWFRNRCRNYCNNCIPPQGPAGKDGNSATINIGTITTGNPGTNAIVTNSGTTSNAILNFVIPRGETAFINSGSFVSKSNKTYTNNDSIIELSKILNNTGIKINNNSIISIPKSGRYLLNYGIKSTTIGNTVGIYINGNNKTDTNIETKINALNPSYSLILNLNTSDTITLGAVNANEATPLTLENVYITIISLD